MNLNKCISSAVPLLTVLWLAGCSSGTDMGGEVKIISITPAAGSERIVGEKLEIAAIIKYSLSGTSGKIDLVVETADGKPIGTANKLNTVDRSGEIITLRKKITVPETTGLRVFAVMRSGSSSDSPGSVDAIRYSVVPNVPVPDEWDAANARVRRLSPHVFAELPAALKDELAKRQCTVPQTYISTRPHNVIQGEFAEKGQKDWAVVCSTGHMSSIIVFLGGSDKDVFQFAAGSDKNYLQGIGGGKIGYSQLIGVVGEDYILEHYKRYGGPTPPPITHDGINVAFVEKASSVLYLEKGEWLSLTGAD